jgi:hydrogenase expression/formation protein HypE
VILGKLSTKDLKELLGCVKSDSRIIIKPQFGFDAGVHKLNNSECLVVSTDPCIGVPDQFFGWFLINYVASDVALFGAKTQFCTINLLGPPSTEPKRFKKVMQQACEAAEQLGITIVTGHTGTYQGLSTLIGVCTGYGQIAQDKLKTPAGAKPNDFVLCVKPVGLETVVNFALAHKKLAKKLFGCQRTEELTELVYMQSCVKEALLLSGLDGVHALHDATEGGVISALNELAEASKVGFLVEWDSFLFCEQVQILRDTYQLSDEQILSMSSTGTFLVAVSPEAKKEVKKLLSQNSICARFVGEFTEDLNRVLVKNGKKTVFPAQSDDPYARILSGKT